MRLQRQGLGDLHQLAPRQRQVLHPRTGIEVGAAEPAQELGGTPPLLAAVDEAEAARRVRQADIVRDAQVGDQGQLLEDRDDARPVGGARPGKADDLPGQPDVAFVGLDHAGDDLDQRRLAGAVLAQDRMNRSLPAGEVDVLQGAHAAVALRDAAHLEQRHRAGVEVSHAAALP